MHWLSAVALVSCVNCTARRPRPKKGGERKDKDIFVNDNMYSINSSTLLKKLDNN